MGNSKWGRAGSTGEVSTGLQAEAPHTALKVAKTLTGNSQEYALAA